MQSKWDIYEQIVKYQYGIYEHINRLRFIHTYYITDQI